VGLQDINPNINTLASTAPGRVTATKNVFFDITKVSEKFARNVGPAKTLGSFFQSDRLNHFVDLRLK
jgi:hypothetical protein